MEIQRIAIIDLDSVMFSIGNPNKVYDDNGIPIRINNKFVYEDKTEEQLIDSSEFIMNTILTNCNATYYIAYIKGKGNYRYSIKDDYKANRPKESPKWWKFTKQYLIDNWNAIEVNNIEVDDAVNITRLNIPDSFICAIDNDLLGLEGKHFNWRINDLNGEWITTNKEQAYYKFWSDMICGQKGDNIQGLKGKGEKFVEKLFSSFDFIGCESYETKVFGEYLNHYENIDLAVDEFYKNYKCLKILETHDNFQIPNPVKYVNRKLKEVSEEKGLFE